MNTTLRLSRPVGSTLLITLVILALLVALLEGLARLPWVETHIPTAVGSSHGDVDVKFGDLDYLLERDGHIDCIVVGSSLVRRGVDPLIVAQVYHAQTGGDLLCYNFGIGAARASGLAVLSEILVKRYHPHLLIFSFSLRDLTGPAYVEQEQKQIVSTPWIQYQAGSFNVTGWLIDHSKALRHFMALREWTSPDFVSPIRDLDDPPHLGYIPQDDLFTGVKNAATAHRFVFADSEWAGLERFLKLRTQTQLLFIEVPASDRLMSQVRGGQDVYRQYVGKVRDFVTGYGIPVRILEASIIPADGWGDAFHLNATGAAVFSQWFGEQIGAAANAGEIVG